MNSCQPQTQVKTFMAKCHNLQHKLGLLNTTVVLIKSSRASSCIRWFKISNVSGTDSIPIIRYTIYLVVYFKSSHAAGSPRRLYQIMSLQTFQVLYYCSSYLLQILDQNFRNCIFTFFSLCVGNLKIKISVLPYPFLMKDCFLQIPHRYVKAIKCYGIILECRFKLIMYRHILSLHSHGLSAALTYRQSEKNMK